MGVEHAAPNIFKFTAENPRERDNAFKHTLKTMDTAVRVKAPLVVLHMGSLEMKDYTDKLLDMVKDGKKGNPKYEKLCQEVAIKREEKKERATAFAYELLGRLVKEAEPRGLKLGIENREALEEIPFESDFPFFFKEFTSPAIVYWHDTGHAQIKENLGFINHALHLDSMAERLYGFHVHDVQFPGRDHRAPGAGMIDFAALKPMVKAEHLKVFEFSPSLTPEEARNGIAHLKSIWGPE
jgi:sugar phosphate isomerase/epimerase